MGSGSRGRNSTEAALSTSSTNAPSPAPTRTEVYEVVGAGDTAIAVLAMAEAAGIPFEASLRLANYAAGLVVRKLGNATTTQQELSWAIGRW